MPRAEDAPFIHVCAPDPALAVGPVAVGLAERLTAAGVPVRVVEVAGRIGWGPEGVCPVDLVTQRDATLTRLISDWPTGPAGGVQLGVGGYPPEFASVSFELDCCLAAALGGGVLVVLDPATSAAATPVVEAVVKRHHATLLGVVSPGGAVVRLAGPADVPTAVAPLLAGDTSLTELLPRLDEASVVVADPARDDLVLGIAIGAGEYGFTKPAALVLSGGRRPDARLVALWERQLPDVPLVQVREPDLPDAAVLVHDTREALVDAPTTPAGFMRGLTARARAAGRSVVLAEGTEPRVLVAAERAMRDGLARIVLLGDEAEVLAAARACEADVSASKIIDPLRSPLRSEFAARYAELRKHRGVTSEQALERMGDGSYFGTMLVLDGQVDAMVSGAAHTTAHTMRPALEVIKTVPGVSIVSSVFLMCLADRVLLYGDCAVNPNPNAAQLAEIAVSSARTARSFGLPPRVAMLSYSTGASGTGPDVDLVVEATRLARELDGELVVDGPLQYDAAVSPDVAQRKAPDSPVAGRANVLVFPDLTAGNIAYKAVQRSSGALAVGPVLQGLRKPVNDLSRGALVEDIVTTIAVSAIQAGGG